MQGPPVLSDAVLAKLGGYQSLRAVVRAINEHVPNAYHFRREALVIVRDSDLRPATNGVLEVDAIGRHLLSVLNQRDPRISSAANRLAAAIGLLTPGHWAALPDSWARDAQAAVTECLLDCPALLHPRLLIPVAERHVRAERRTVLDALMRAGAELPSVRHGASPERVRAFANTPVLLAALTQKVPKRSILSGHSQTWPAPTDSRELPLETVEVARPAPGFITSLLELSSLREAPGPEWPLEEPSLSSGARVRLWSAVVVAAGLGKQPCPAEPRTALVRALRDTRVVANDVVRSDLAWRLLNRAIEGDRAPFERDGPGAPQAHARVTAALQFAVEAGIAEDLRAAGHWIFRECLAPNRSARAELPHADVPHACAVFQALTDAGVDLAECGAPGEPPGRGDATYNRELWAQAYAIVATERAMSRVIEDAETPDRMRAPLRVARRLV